MEIKDQLQEFLKANNLRRSAFAKEIGVDPATITRILAGQADMKATTYQKIKERIKRG